MNAIEFRDYIIGLLKADGKLDCAPVPMSVDSMNSSSADIELIGGDSFYIEISKWMGAATEKEEVQHSHMTGPNNLQEKYNSNTFVFLTNSLGETDNGDITDTAMYNWYDTLGTETKALLYLAKDNDDYGIIAICEYNWYMQENHFQESAAAMHKAVYDVADLIHNSSDFEGFPVYYGIETGFDGGKSACDEVAIFIPYFTEPEVVKNILKKLDNVIKAKATLY